MGETKCQSAGCDKPAQFHPVLKLWPSGFPKAAHQPLLVTIYLPLCPACMDASTVADVLSDEGWQKIASSMGALGRVEPDREGAELDRERIYGA